MNLRIKYGASCTKETMAGRWRTHLTCKLPMFFLVSNFIALYFPVGLKHEKKDFVDISIRTLNFVPLNDTLSASSHLNLDPANSTRLWRTSPLDSVYALNLLRLQTNRLKTTEQTHQQRVVMLWVVARDMLAGLLWRGLIGARLLTDVADNMVSPVFECRVNLDYINKKREENRHHQHIDELAEPRGQQAQNNGWYDQV